MERQMENFRTYPVMVDQDWENEGCFSVWTDVPDTINAELCSGIADRRVADYIAKLWNDNRPQSDC